MAPKRKKAREKSPTIVSKKCTSPRRKGCPLSDLPLDILYEIFGLLHPLDLLYLARTNKLFRAFLTARSSSRLWKTALQQIAGLPECPIDLSLIEYTRLVFDRTCYVCLEPTNCPILWPFRTRYCENCVVPRTTRVLPRRLTTDRSVVWTNLFPKAFVECRSGNMFHGPQVQGFAELYCNLQNFDQRQLAVSNQRTVTNGIMQHATLCASWESAEKKAQELKIRAIKTKRRKEILTRLAQLGMQEGITHSQWILDSHPLVQQPEILTDHSWERIRHELVDFLEKEKSNRILTSDRQEYRLRFSLLNSVVNEFYSLEHQKQVVPRTLDICFFSVVRDILDVDPSVEITKEYLRVQILPSLSKFIATWKTDIESRLLSLASAQLHAPVGTNPLKLACTLFRCSKCKITRSYPAILAHGCLYESFDPDIEHWSSYDTRPQAMYNCHPWSCDILDSNIWRERVAKIICAVGMDPQSTTCDDMDVVDARFRCALCHLPERRSIMTWRTARNHCVTNHGDTSDDVQWIHVSKGEEEQAKKLEVASMKVSLQMYEDGLYWSCLLCNTKDLSKGDISKHVCNSHRMQNPTEGVEYHRNLDSPPLVLEPVVLLSAKRAVIQLRPWGQWVDEGRACYYRFPSP